MCDLFMPITELWAFTAKDGLWRQTRTIEESFSNLNAFHSFRTNGSAIFRLDRNENLMWFHAIITVGL